MIGAARIISCCRESGSPGGWCQFATSNLRAKEGEKLISSCHFDWCRSITQRFFWKHWPFLDPSSFPRMLAAACEE